MIRHLKKGMRKGVYYMEFDLKATADEVPMNWYLSQNGLKRIEEKARQLGAEIPDLQTREQANVFVQEAPVRQTESKPAPAVLKIDKPTTENEHISPATHPHLYYYSKKKKMWKLRKDADFNINAIKPLSKKFQKRLLKSNHRQKRREN